MPQTLVRHDDPEVEVAVFSEVGRRKENQDWMSWSRIPWGECYIVADGMGGYKGGALASRMTVEGLERHLNAQAADVPFEQALQEAVSRTNREVYRKAQSDDPETNHMGSTVAVALIAGNQLQVGHIGDSRIYFLHRNCLKLLTTDHTSVQRMVDAGMISQDQARHHPDAHVLSRAVGSRSEVDIEVGSPIPLEEGDGVLLCSDGLSGYVEDKEIERIVCEASDVQRIPKRLVQFALDAGSDDNITVQFVCYGKPVGKKRRQTARLSPFRQASGFRRVARWLWLGFILLCALAAAAVVLKVPQIRTRLAGWLHPSGVPASRPIRILIRSEQETLAGTIIERRLAADAKPLPAVPPDVADGLPSGCFIFYPDPALEPQARKLAQGLNAAISDCRGDSKFGLYQERQKLEKYVRDKTGGPALLIVLPKK